MSGSRPAVGKAGDEAASAARGDHLLTKIKVEPNPAVEGQPVTITVPDKGPWFIAGNPNGDIREYKPDANNQIELLAPPGQAGSSFTITDFGTPPENARIDIVSTE